MKPTVAVIGSNHLADATRGECAMHFQIVDPYNADLVWFCEDMPVSETDESNVDWVLKELSCTLATVRKTTPVLISTQVPVGFCAKAEAEWPEHHLAIQPENIRKAHARADFHFQKRIVVGTRHPEDHELIFSVVSKFCPDPNGILFMSPESAEVTKHALNGWLALGIVYANEIAALCDAVGADRDDVSWGWRSDRRVGNQPTRYGGPITGGTLLRDVAVMDSIGAGPVISAIRPSNTHRLQGDQ